ncbi:S8 family peptidase [Dyadobacter fermentans]|uniref:Peptidase S8 and S53 subtilisin kexin sedolisin n=1 Tax=Dyadobacter fermentans (strain ATCC 700827 / DSM 18053 / CIP 107007 / KCTC 52180 / NS114) TaxID=471854 RepID=C6W7L3_DYAFD|nr:S8 family peptidase [Dyadobacter fermentans]ACT96207.1 peptidase S8 and S53 subtilisin kexin sedolisin [Dyadobacter fermentans DSM 18053]
MRKTILLATFSFLLVRVTAFAQSSPRYLVLFKDKGNTTFSVDKPTEFLSQRSVDRRNKQNIAITTNDLPVNPGYLFAIRQIGAQVIYPTRWFNGALVEASDAQLTQIKALPFYKGIELNLPVANITSKSPGIARTAATNRKLETVEEVDYGQMNRQLALMEVADLHKKGFRGENMLIAVLDNGFSQADEVAYFKQLRDDKRIVDTHDFVARDGNVYNDGFHGLNVMSTIAAYLPGNLVGSAFKASFAMYVTENNAGESPYEEITWLMAAERADSLGADVINSSLGYTTFDDEYDSPAYNHTYKDMDGKTTIVSRAARYATRKGILVVNSAGNDGNNSWQYVGAPADVDSVLTVGASNYDRSYSSLSSIGPNAAGIQKPDVAAVGAGTIIGDLAGGASSGYGTSFSAPQIAGLAAVLWQAFPQLTAQQVIYVLKKSGHMSNSPNNMLGYGVPNAVKAQEIAKNEFSPLGTENALLSSVTLSPNPAQNEVTLAIPHTLVGKTGHVSLYAANGASLYDATARLGAKHVIATAQLASGLYLVRLQVDSYERTLKFIKR